MVISLSIEIDPPVSEGGNGKFFVTVNPYIVMRHFFLGNSVPLSYSMSYLET